MSDSGLPPVPVSKRGFPLLSQLNIRKREIINRGNGWKARFETGYRAAPAHDRKRPCNHSVRRDLT
jgi:hypothetical protein